MKKEFIKNISFSFLQQFTIQFVAFFLFVLLARLLSPEDFGLFAMSTIVLQIGQVLVDLGLTQSLVRNQTSNQIELSSCFFISLSFAVLYYIFIYLISPILGKFYQSDLLSDMIRVQTIGLVFFSISNFYIAILCIQQQFKTQLILSIPSVIIASLCSIYMAYNGMGVWSLVAYTFIQSSIFATLLAVSVNWKPFFKFSFVKIKHHLQFGKNITISGIIDVIFLNINQLILGKIYNKNILGFYNRAETLKQLPVSNFTYAINKVSFPLLSKFKDDIPKLKSMFMIISKTSYFIMLPIIIYTIIYAEPMFVFLFSDKWLESVPYFQILSIGAIFFPSHVLNLNLLNIKGRSDLFLKLELIKKLILIILIAMAYNFGIYGLIWAQVLFSFMAFIINSYYTGSIIDYSFFKQLKDGFQNILYILVIFGTSFFIDIYFKSIFITNFWRLMISFIYCFTFYIIFAYISKNEVFVHLINIIKKNND